MCDPLVESGWTDPEELQRMRDAIVACGAAEDAFYCRARCETVARKRFSPWRLVAIDVVPWCEYKLTTHVVIFVVARALPGFG